MSVCDHENVEKMIKLKIVTQDNCIVAESKQPGIITEVEKCPKYANRSLSETDIGRLCDWNFCKSYICCPRENIEKIWCTSHDDSTYDHILEVGGPCVLKTTNQQGICMSHEKCRSISQKSKNYQLCGTDCCSDFICCPSPDPISMTPSERACASYRNHVYESIRFIESYEPPGIDNIRYCKSTKTYGDFLTKPKEIPHFAALGYESQDKTIVWNCGGTLISDRYVLTAGQCLNLKNIGEVKYVQLGMIYLKVTNNTQSRYDCPEEFGVTERIPHPKYKNNSPYNNIALLRLDRNVEFNPNIRPACLSDSSELPKDISLLVTGFTNNEEWLNKLNPSLIKIYLDYFTRDDCLKTFMTNVSHHLKNGIDDSTQFCAGSNYPILLQDLCPGDLGLPIELQHSEYYKMSKVIGIASVSLECKMFESLGIYTRVFPYLKWIERIVWPEIV